MLQKIMARMRTMVTRGRVQSVVMHPKRTLVQLAGLNGETKTKIEVFNPMGFSFWPKGGSEVVMLQVGGSRAHMVAMFADDPALRISDLAEGEFGWRDYNGQQIVFRTDRLEITSPKKVVANITGDVSATIGGNLEVELTGNLDANISGDATLTVDGTATVDCDDINLGGAGGLAVKRSDGSNATKVKAV